MKSQRQSDNIGIGNIEFPLIGIFVLIGMAISTIIYIIWRKYKCK